MKYFLLFTLLFSISICHAQTEIGLKGGINIANLHYKYQGDTDNGNSLVSFHLGFFFDNPVSEKFSIQPELLFSMQGNTIPSPAGDLKEQLGYINIPVLFKGLPAPNFAVYGGPQIGILVMSNEINGVSVQNFYKTTDVSLVFGLEAEPAEKFRIGARYNYGLSNVDDSTDGLTITNRVGQIYVGILF